MGRVKKSRRMETKKVILIEFIFFGYSRALPGSSPAANVIISSGSCVHSLSFIPTIPGL